MEADPELEAFLRQFRPAAPKPLPRAHGPRRVRELLAAASVILALAAWVIGRAPSTPSAHVERRHWRPTLGSLNQACRLGACERALDEVNEGVLPDPARKGGALVRLADVGQDR